MSLTYGQAVAKEINDYLENPTSGAMPVDAMRVAVRLLSAEEPAARNVREAWNALRMIREAIETLGPIGVIEAEERMTHGPTLTGEATVLVEGIKTMASKGASHDQA